MGLFREFDYEFLVRGKEKVTLRETITRNTALDAELTRKLLSLRDPRVDRALAGNRTIDSDTLKALLAKNDVQIHKALAMNPGIDDELFAALLEKGEEVTSMLLLHQPIDADRLSQIEKRGVPGELFALIGANESLSSKVVSQLFEKGESEVLKALSGNRMVSPDMLEHIYQEREEENFVHLTKNPSTPGWILQAIYDENGQEHEMLVALAHNPALPEKILRALFEKEDLEINRGLATNASLPMELLDILKIDTRLQNELAQNENLMRSYEEVLNQSKAMMNV